MDIIRLRISMKLLLDFERVSSLNPLSLSLSLSLSLFLFLSLSLPSPFSVSLSRREIFYYNTIKGYNNADTNYTAEWQLTEQYATVTTAWAFYYERLAGQLALLNYSQLTHSPPAFTLSRENFIPRRAAKGILGHARARAANYPSAFSSVNRRRHTLFKIYRICPYKAVTSRLTCLSWLECGAGFIPQASRAAPHRRAPVLTAIT